MISVRDDLASLDGYHSPQVDVDVRMNTNESPFPPPADFRRRVGEAAAAVDWHRYPDRAAIALRQALASSYGVDVDQVFVANGSNEVLQTILLTFAGPGRRALTFEPTYAMHTQIARLSATEVIEAERGADFTLDPDAVTAAIMANRPAVTFLCSPNNPTGMLEPPETIRSAIDAVAAVDGLLVVDEAYGQFSPQSALELVGPDIPLVVTRTFSKTWSMAAARLGYLIGPASIVAEFDKVTLPYHLDAFKQQAGLIALDYRDEMNARVAMLVEERGRLNAALTDLPVTVWPSAANFILFRPDEADGDEVWRQLVDRSVLVRNCSSWPRLDGCLRVTVGTPDENEKFVAALRAVLRGS